MERSLRVEALPTDVIAYFVEPRNLIMANHPGPVIASSGAPYGTGSWAILAFDQIQLRVDYELVEARRLIARTTASGRMSGGMQARLTIELSFAVDRDGTDVHAVLEGRGGWVASRLARWTTAPLWRRMERDLGASPT